MKVLEEGNWSKDDVYCPECHSRLFIEEKDVHWGTFKGRDNKPDEGFFFICSNCGSHCALFVLPPLVAERVHKKFAKPKEVKRGHQKK